MKFMFIYKNRNMPLHFSYINIYITSITIIIASSDLSNKHLGFVPCDRSLNPSKTIYQASTCLDSNCYFT